MRRCLRIAPAGPRSISDRDKAHTACVVLAQVNRVNQQTECAHVNTGDSSVVLLTNLWCIGRNDTNVSSLSRDGNLVNVGNFDAKGVNGDNWKPLNANDNVGASFSRSVARKGQGFALIFPFVASIQPPSIWPITMVRSLNSAYL